MKSHMTRRAAVRSAAWAVPSIVVVSAAPAFAASGGGTVTGVMNPTTYNPTEFPANKWPSPQLTVTNNTPTPTIVIVNLLASLTSGPNYTNFDPYTDNGVFGKETLAGFTGQTISLRWTSTRALVPGESGTIVAAAGWRDPTSFALTFSATLTTTESVPTSPVAPASVSYTLPASRSRSAAPAPSTDRSASSLP